MTVSLQKGESVSLTKEEPGLESVIVGLGWDANDAGGSAFDLDASCFLLNADGKVNKDSDFVFFNNLKSDCGSVVHMGDNLTGEGDGDDEQITVDLTKVPESVKTLAFTVTIYQAVARNQLFSMVKNAYIRVVNQKTGNEIARFDLSNEATQATAVLFGEISRDGTEWKFNAVEQGNSEGLHGFTSKYGVNC